MTAGYVADGQYLRHYSAVTGSGTTQTYTFDGPTQLSDGTATYAFAGIPFATPSGAPYAAVAVTFVGSGAATLRTHYVYTAADGSIYLDDTITYDANGRPIQVYDTGHVFDGLPYASHRDTYSAAGVLTQQVYYDQTGALYLTGTIATGGGITYRDDYNAAGKIVHEHYTTTSGQVYLDATLAYSGTTVTMQESGLMIQSTGFGSRTEIYDTTSNYYAFATSNPIGALREQIFYDGSGNAVLDQVHSVDGLTVTSTGSYFNGRAYSTVIETYAYGSPMTGLFNLQRRAFLNLDGSESYQPAVSSSYTSRVLGAGVPDADDIYDFRTDASDPFTGLAVQSSVVLNAGFGHDSIYGFNPYTGRVEVNGPFLSPDRLYFNSAVFATLNDVRAAAQVSPVNPLDIIITDVQGDTLVLYGVLHDTNNGFGTRHNTINDALNASDVFFR